ncbi:SEC7 domain-containing protein [Cyclospora cayetanensis]|uniref:SEC7 domain-containing protein n=1 Tax=Cyclospora cayetanensis TaxID=88456 RepID=A0A1D3CR88_9EIME|nr:SEC7 domain-containing protein [Cyclospora cayetanensis]
MSHASSSFPPRAADSPAELNGSSSGGSGIGDTRGDSSTMRMQNNPSSPAAVRTDVPRDVFEEMTPHGSDSEGWVQPSSSVSCLTNQGGLPESLYPPLPLASGEFASLASSSNSGSKVMMTWQQGETDSAPAAPAPAKGEAFKEVDCSWAVVDALKREVFAISALLRALRMHTAVHTRGLSAVFQQQLAAAVAPLIKSFELLSERLAAAEAAKEAPPAELQEQHIHPFLFVYGGSFLVPTSPAAEEELLLLQCLDLLSNSLLNPAGYIFTDTCVARTLQCCLAIRCGVPLPQRVLGGCLYLSRGYGLDCRVRLLNLLEGLLSADERGSNCSTGSSGGVLLGGGSKEEALPPFVSFPEAVSPHHADAEEAPPSEQSTEATANQNRLEDGLQTASAAAGSPVGAAQLPRLSVTPEGGRVGSPSGMDRDVESVLRPHIKDKALSLEARLLCLRLLAVALEAGKESFALFPALLHSLQKQLLPLVLQLDTRSAPLLLLSLTLRVLGDFIAFLRPYIKDEMERCLYQLLRLSTCGLGCGGSSRTALATEAQDIALDMLRELCSDASFGFELLLNYDGDIRRSNVLGVLLALLMQLGAPRIPPLRGVYRFADCDCESAAAVVSGQGAGGSVPAIPLSLLSPAGTACTTTGTDAALAKGAPQILSPAGTTAAAALAASAAAADAHSKPHHHGAFHLRKAPSKSPLRASRSAADSGSIHAAATESLAVDAAGITRPAGLSNVNRLALAALLRLIAALVARCDSLKRDTSSREQQQQQPQEAKDDRAHLDSESAAAYFLRIQDTLSIAERRKNKALLAHGAALFNANVKEALLQLESLGLLPKPATPRSLALFLKETRGLDLRTVGLYLSTNKPWNTQVLQEFVGLFSFGGVGLVAALREFLRTFRLPGESQQIERVMEAFADEFFRQQPLVTCPENQAKIAKAKDAKAAELPSAGETQSQKSNSTPAAEPLELGMWRWVADEGFYCTSRATAEKEGALTKPRSCDALTKQLAEFSPSHAPPGYVLMLHKDTVFVLSYSIIMLNTDQHNSQVRSKMRVEDFVKNNRGINNGADLPHFFLQNVYISIKHQEIKLKEAACSALPPSQSASGQRNEALTKDQQQQQLQTTPDLFDVLANGWTPVEGAGLGWAAFASPYGGSTGPSGLSDAGSKYHVVEQPRGVVLRSGDVDARRQGCRRGALRADVPAAAGFEGEMFHTLWSGGCCLAVLRGAFEASLDLRQLEEILYFEGVGGAALPSLCTSMVPPPFVPPASRRDRGGSGRKGGGWLGDLTSILFALGESDEESEGDEAGGGATHGPLVALSEGHVARPGEACIGACGVKSTRGSPHSEGARGAPREGPPLLQGQTWEGVPFHCDGGVGVTGGEQQTMPVRPVAGPR